MFTRFETGQNSDNGYTAIMEPKTGQKVRFFLGCVLIIVGKHAETESLIKMHIKRKHFSEICSEQILTRVKIYLHKMGHGGEIVIIFTKQITYRYLLSLTYRGIII